MLPTCSPESALEIFNEIDVNNNGALDQAEFLLALEKTSVIFAVYCLCIKIAEISHIFVFQTSSGDLEEIPARYLFTRVPYDGWSHWPCFDDDNTQERVAELFAQIGVENPNGDRVITFPTFLNFVCLRDADLRRMFDKVGSIDVFSSRQHFHTFPNEGWRK